MAVSKIFFARNTQRVMRIQQLSEQNTTWAKLGREVISKIEKFFAFNIKLSGDRLSQVLYRVELAISKALRRVCIVLCVFVYAC